MLRRLLSVSVALSAVVIAAPLRAQDGFNQMETTIADLHRALEAKSVTCHSVVQTYLDRIAAYDQNGPKLSAIRAVNPAALKEADAYDAKSGSASDTPLACVPLVLKDNYNTAELPTTGGSASLAENRPARDAFVTAKLRQAGAIILAKTNMQELALGGVSVSSIGGQVLNPYDLTLTPGGSSGGTGAAVAANLALAGTGSDTVNSIRSPASANNLVGLRPTKGLVSVNGIMPVSSTQDAVGPLARSVADVAALLQVMAGRDPDDPLTKNSETAPSYASFLKPDALKGARLGVVKTLFGTKPDHAEVNRVMQGALDTLAAAGATLVTIDDPAIDAVALNADDVQTYEFKFLFNRYLAGLKDPPKKDLAAMIASGAYYKPALGKFLATAEARSNGMEEPEYRQRLEHIATFKEHLASVFDKEKLDGMVYPMQKRLVVPVGQLDQAERNGIVAGLTGYPAIDIPAGFSKSTGTAPLGVPVGMDILGRPWTEGKLLGFAYSFEKARPNRQPPLSAPPLAAGDRR